MRPLSLLGLSGSLKATSINGQLLRAAARLAPEGCELQLYAGVGALPHYTPDLDDEHPPALVRDLRAGVARADGLVICCPEYARGVPGSFKNALDWLAGGVEAYGKWVSCWNASPQSTHAQAALGVILPTLGARLHRESSIALQLRGRGLSADEIAGDRALSEAIGGALSRFVVAVRASPAPEG